MSLFRKKPPPPTPDEINQQLLDRVAELEGIIHQRDLEAFRRAVPTLGNLGDALVGLAHRAVAGDEKAKDSLAQFFTFFDRARTASQRRITLVRRS